MHELLPLFLLFFLGLGAMTWWLLNQMPVSARQSPPPPAGQTGGDYQQSAHPEFPPGQGREAFLRLCVKCHSPTIVMAYGQKREGWENTITKMVRLGAQGSDEDFTDIAD